MAARLKAWVVAALRTSLYQLGVLGLAHRWRNSRTLTVLMFHRVLPRNSVAFGHAEREFTFSVEGFAACLDFLKRHYNVIDPRQLMGAQREPAILPPRAALITFDDGWRDTLIHACPELERRGLPAVLFLATEVVDSECDRWWQDLLVEIVAEPARAANLARRLGLPNHRATDIQALSAAMATMAPGERIRLLNDGTEGPILERQMLTRQEAMELNSRGVTLAAHGHGHGPLTRIGDPAADLARSREVMDGLGGIPTVMSFPHGACDEMTIAQARQAGFEWLFSSAPRLNSLDRVAHRQILGRLHIPENEWTCSGGKISFPRLASFLFFRPRAGRDAHESGTRAVGAAG